MTTKVVKVSNKDILESFTLLRPKKYDTIKTNDFIRYYIGDELKYGGFVKMVNHDKKYIVLANYNKHLTWCVQLNNPDLKMYIRTKAKMDAEKKKKNELYKLFKEGKIKLPK